MGKKEPTISSYAAAASGEPGAGASRHCIGSQELKNKVLEPSPGHTSHSLLGSGTRSLTQSLWGSHCVPAPGAQQSTQNPLLSGDCGWVSRVPSPCPPSSLPIWKLSPPSWAETVPLPSNQSVELAVPERPPLTPRATRQGLPDKTPGA